MSKERIYFDCNAAYGEVPNKVPEARWSLGHLLDDLDLAGIAGALVYHRQAVHFDPMLGNRRLVEEISEHRDRLYPCWVAMPTLGDNFPGVSEFMALARQHNVRAVRIPPERFAIPIKESVWSELRDALLEEDILCVVPAYPGTSFDGLDNLLTIFHRNKVLMTGHHWWNLWRRMVVMMDEHPKLHIEFSAFQANRAIEYFVGRFGAERCLFGTGLPEKAPGAARGFVDFTLLSEEDAALVAGGNLRRLLGGQAPSAVPSPGQWHDRWTVAARAGRPLTGQVLDAHCHIMHDGGENAGCGLVFHRGDADGMIELTRRAGIDKTAIMSWAGPLSMNTRLGNETVANAVARYPNEFIGLSTINPDYDDSAEIESIIQKYHVELGFPGLKTFTPSQSIDYDDPLFAPWYQYGNDHNLYAVIDPKGGVRADRVVRNLAKRYPRLGLHLDHCGQSWEYAKWAVSLMHDHDNIWAQLNYTSVTNGVIEYLAEQVGADRMLFGTDAPMRDPRPQVGWVVFTRLKEGEKAQIFGANFADILRGAGVGV